MSLLDKYQTFLSVKPENDKDSNVLIIDGLNTLIRVFSVVPSVNDKDEHVGAIVGFLRSIGANIRQFSPTRCIVVFDGSGGSQRRRKIYPEYKANRKVKKSLNRHNEFVDLESELESMKIQAAKILNYITMLPVTFIRIDNIEADDTIAFICQQYYKDVDNKITIVSSDRDFLQLVNHKIKVWSPVKKKLYTAQELEKETGLHPRNYLLYRTFSGDGSDNISGVPGIKLKTLIKCFPIITKDDIEISNIIEYAKQQTAQKSKLKAHAVTIANEHILLRNYQLMQLSKVDISGASKLIIIDLMNAPINYLNEVLFRQTLIKDTIDINVKNYLHDGWNKLNLYARK